ncbi:MAG TPA: PQQ-dependent sugar dehydrogenase [Methanothrix sp.]|nr:PQQ-dependent sugar dehydrogenase [Methanothrix sp.]
MNRVMHKPKTLGAEAMAFCKAKAFGAILLILLVQLLLLLPAAAHPPSQVSLNYDSANQSLQVTTTHTVSNPSGHYVFKVDVLKNGEMVLTKEYTSQPTGSTFTYDYPVNATAGDVLKATAYCSIAGSRSAEITVGDVALKVMQAEEEASDLPLEKVRLPPGFKIEIYAENLTYARSLAISPNGTLFVGTRLPFETLDSPNGLAVYAIVDKNQNHYAEENEIFTVAEGLNNPNGVAFRDGSLYVAEIDRIIRFEDIESRLAEDGGKPFEPVTVKELPQYLLHGWRYIGFGPDGKLYLAMGAACNVCQHNDELNGTIVRMNPDGSDMEVFAKGVRNSVGFDWDPATSEMWFTDNGRDLLGNDVPSDELNHAPVAGLDFGFPTCHSGSIPDPDLGSNENYTCNQKVPPAWMLGPHVAPLGMRFYSGSMLPEEYQGSIIIAEHGSWNRDKPIGYRVAAVLLKNNTAVGQQIIAEGWLDSSANDTVWGRPVDVLSIDDGSLLVSDDLNGVIYRISYSQN